MTAQEIFIYLSGRRIISDCIAWCRQDPDFRRMSRHSIYRIVEREQQNQPLTPQLDRYLDKIKKYVEIKKSEVDIARELVLRATQS